MHSKDINIKILNGLSIILIVLSTGLLGFSASSMGQYIDPVAEAARSEKASFLMKASLGNALSSGRIGKTRFHDSKAMQVYYDTRGSQPFWMGDRRSYSHAEKFLEVLETSWTHGLNPYNYHIEKIRDQIENPNMLKKAELELLLTDAFIRYARDLSGIRVNPKSIKLDPDDWRAPMQSYDILGFLSDRNRFDKALKAIEPKSTTYKKLQKELIRLSEQDVEVYEQHLPIIFGGLMKPGWGHKAIPKLRARMGLPQPERNKGKYDDALAAAVMKFQRANELEPDGIIGDKTLQLLNRTKNDKMLQLVANMERLRWVEEQKPDRFIVVNIPSATLWALDQGRVKLEMPVIVGSPWRRTRTFKTEVRGVRLNPKWTIPPTVKKFDILPKVQENSNYLSDKGIELFRGYGRNAITLDPASIDWNNVSTKELHGIRMVQTPGEHNPLGRVRILMPNDYNMYLHDTNHPEYFDKPERAVSSGCIRMKYPEKVASFVMGREQGWNQNYMDEVFETNKETDHKVAERMPVYVLYYTAWIGDKGQVVYGTDVYNYDNKLIDLLADIDGFHIPVHYNGESGRVASSL
ncbi:MAG: murein L,D-transpeptidase [Micavibrio sp.]|nr:MAG: murein L,D-transpeptidase [Micavibrio sp.]